MIEVFVWLLISTSAGGYNYGTVSLIERFKTEDQCTHVLKNIPVRNQQEAKCIQANIYINAPQETKK